jgi:hypothetical protein
LSKKQEEQIRNRAFARALTIANSCAHEHLFVHKYRGHDDIDCDYCPGLNDCIKFWNNYVVNTLTLKRAATKKKTAAIVEAYVNNIFETLTALKRAKRIRSKNEKKGQTN